MKPDPSGNLQANATIEWTNQVLGYPIRTYNIQDTYVYDADQWMGILTAADFAVRSMYHQTNKNIWANYFWVRNNPPNQSYSKFETHMSAETDTILKLVL